MSWISTPTQQLTTSKEEIPSRIGHFSSAIANIPAPCIIAISSSISNPILQTADIFFSGSNKYLFSPNS